MEVSERHDGPIHLLLTDLVMPRMSGGELAQRLAASRPETKVLYTSGYVDDRSADSSLRLSSTAFLQKPYAPEKLARKVRDVLAGPRPPTA